MNNNDFWDFAAFWEFFNPLDEKDEFKCPNCGRIIKGNEKVHWIDKENKIFMCPGCDEEINLS